MAGKRIPVSLLRPLLILWIAVLTFPAGAASASDASASATATMRVLIASSKALHADVSAFRTVRKRFECVALIGSRAEVIAQAGGSATVLVDIDATGTLPVTHAACGFPSHWLVRLREHAGRWQAERVWMPESDVAARIAAASDPSARLSILEEQPRYVTPELARSLAERGSVLLSQSKSPQEVADLAEAALTIAEETRSPNERARALVLLGRSFDRREQFTTAMALYQRARGIAEKTGDLALIASALSCVAAGRDRLGQPAVEEASEAYRLAKLVGDDRVAGASLYLLGVDDEYSGRYGDAIEKYTETARRAKRCGERLLEAVATAQTGVAYGYIGNRALAYEFMDRGIELFRRAGNARGVILNLRNLADMEAIDGRYDAAEKHLRQTDDLLAKAPNVRTSAYVAATRAHIASARHDYAAAARFNTTGLELAKRAGIEYLVTIYMANLAGVRLDQKRYDEAVALATDAIQRSAAGPPVYDAYWHSHMVRGKALVALGRLDEARGSYESAIAAIEQSRPNVPAPDEDQQLFLDDKDRPYYEMFRTFIGRDPAEALLWVERARSRTLIEFLTYRHRKSIKSLSAEEQAGETRVEKEMAETNVSLREARAQTSPDAGLIGRLEKKLAELRNRRAVVLRELYERHPELAIARGDIPLPSVDEMRATLAPDEIVAEYVSLPDGAWLIAVTRETAPRIYPIHSDEEKLRALSEALSKSIAARDTRVFARSRTLYDLLLRPAEGLLRGKKTIGIVPDGALRTVPFQMLQRPDGKFLIQQHAVFYAPSLAFLHWRFTHPTAGAERQLLAMANPTVSAATVSKSRQHTRSEDLGSLPEAEEEVRGLQSIYGRAQTTLRIGAAATEKDFKHEASRYRVLHLATHGMYDDRDPMYSHLVLARDAGDDDDGLLEAREIVDLDLHAGLAVLSACETGRMRALGGEGMVGLSWAFLGAGCPETVVSMWPVESAATARMMIDFHRRLVAGASTPEALRRAEMALMGTRRYHHPRYWAPFVVVGAPPR